MHRYTGLDTAIRDYIIGLYTAIQGYTQLLKDYTQLSWAIQRYTQVYRAMHERVSERQACTDS